MVNSTPLLSLLATASVLVNSVSATLPAIVIKGSKMFYSNNGTQFFIKGVAYQSGVAGSGTTKRATTTTGYTDPLADITTCNRDIPYLQKLGANAIRTYAIDPTADHSACMKALDTAGIYVISDLGEPNLSINRDDPAWNTELYARYTGVIDSLATYSNVIGFFAGNEVSNAANYTGASAFVKAAVRDSKAYIKSKGYTAGVGYAADDDATVRAGVAAYFNCGDVADQIDFWGYNIYEWCGDSSYETSGYADRVAEFSSYSVPAFFAEYGCNTQGGGAAGREFTEVAALYGSNMTGTFSGGIVYEYFQEDNDYGLASVVNTASVSLLADYSAFSTQIHAATPTGVNSASYTPTNTVGQACPTVDSKWLAATKLPPTPNTDVCACMVSSLSCVAAATVDTDDIATLFSQVCGYIGGKACAGIARNTTTGTYGAYSMCNATQQLSNAFDTYYKAQGSVSTACDFGSNAVVVKAASAASSCSSIVAAATSANPVTSSSGSAATTSKANDGGMSMSATLGMGKYFAVVFTAVGLASGFGMILL